MKFLKPKFWHKNQISFFSILLFPISAIVLFVNFIKYYVIKKHSYSIPIICVGNIYLGGTGKTPFCIELFSMLKGFNKKIVFIRKKYNSFQDEVNLLKLTAPVYESKKRMNALNEAIQNNAEIAILDDGFQDFSIKKKISIICFNENQWIGNGLVIPSGPLRENLSALKRANYTIINGKKNTNIEKEILKKNSKIKIFYSSYKPLNIEEFKNSKVIAFAGIGNPDNFFDLLKNNNINILEKISFPDHYDYSSKELDHLLSRAEKTGSTLLTTEKDFYRISKKFQKNVKYLKIKVDIENKEKLIEEIKVII